MTVAPAAADAVEVVALRPYVLRIVLDDGRTGTFDVGPYLDFPAFAALRDPGYFARVGIENGVVAWPGSEDLAPETVVARLRDGEGGA